jgi:hypothetical protein
LSTAIDHVISDVHGALQEAPAGTCVLHASPSWYFSANAGKPFRKELDAAIGPSFNHHRYTLSCESRVLAITFPGSAGGSPAGFAIKAGIRM